MTIGLINISGCLNCRCLFKGALFGTQIGLFNKAVQNLGNQIGLYNFANMGNSVVNANFLSPLDLIGKNGLQLGLINRIRYGEGVQVGLLNFRKGNVWYAKVLPIVNFKIEKKVVD